MRIPNLHALRCALLLAALAATCAASRAQAPGLTPGLTQLLGGVYADASCAQELVTGMCRCGMLACGLRVLRFVPVAVVETTAFPGDSLMDAGALSTLAAPGTGALSSSLSASDNTAEVHVWSIPDPAGIACATCIGADARSPSAARADAAGAICGPAALTAQEIRAAGASALPGAPALLYASELDWLNWRTGCRDIADPASRVPVQSILCAAQPLGSPVGAASGAGCIGQWGSLVPRQMRDIGPPPPLYSAKTAVRAMSLAREQLGLFPYPVDTGGKLQQVYPAVSACFPVGQLPLPQLPGSPRPVVTSADGRYAWVYWRAAQCCVGYGAAAQCLRRSARTP